MTGFRGKQTGFSIVEMLITVIVIAVVAGAGWLVYQSRSKLTNSTSNSNQTNNNQQTNTKSQPDVYANWKTYCDSVYHYCFKYPQDWTFSSTAATKLGSSGETSLLNPAKTVSVTYDNVYTQDSRVTNFITASLDKLAGANQDLTIVGGYIPTSGDNGLAGNNVPSYWMVDTSLLSTYSLTVGTESQFPNNPSFTDKNTGSMQYSGRLKVAPAVTINSLDETHAWFNNADTKTAMLILKSFYYQP